MCGISGIISTKNILKYKSNVELSLKEISHRGPDDINLFVEDNICFGYVRLAIRGLSSKYNQPFISNDIVGYANGEVYSVNDNLESNESCDLQPLLKMVEKKEKIYDYCDADFAICCYDKINKKVYFARDFFGIKPLYYYWLDDETLAFSSEIKGLKKMIPKKLELSVDTIFDYLVFGYPLDNKTFYKDVYSFNSKTVYEWDLVSNTKIEHKYKVNYINYNLKHSNINQCIQQSVKSRLKSDRKVGAHLSGGYDSSLIAYIANNNIDYYTAYNSQSDNDLNISKKIADELNLKINTIFISQEINYRELINILDSPIMSTGAFVPYVISKTASEQGCRVLLAGQGADELFLGYDRFSKIRNVKSKEELFKLLVNSDLDMLRRLFKNINIRKKYKDILNGSNYLKLAQEFYIENFLSELLHIEDHMHMNFSIENRVPYLSMKTVNFIRKNGICISENCKKDAIYNANVSFNSQALKRKNKENMNRNLSDELAKLDFDVIFKQKIFDGFDYKTFEEYIHDIQNLNKKQLFTIWAIYNIQLWYELNDFEEKIIL